jgi:hypothetical protein
MSNNFDSSLVEIDKKIYLAISEFKKQKNIGGLLKSINKSDLTGWYYEVDLEKEHELVLVQDNFLFTVDIERYCITDDGPLTEYFSEEDLNITNNSKIISFQKNRLDADIYNDDVICINDSLGEDIILSALTVGAGQAGINVNEIMIFRDLSSLVLYYKKMGLLVFKTNGFDSLSHSDKELIDLYNKYLRERFLMESS